MLRMQFIRNSCLFIMPLCYLYLNMEGRSLDSRFEAIEPIDRKVVEVLCIWLDLSQVMSSKHEFFLCGWHFHSD